MGVRTHNIDVATLADARQPKSNRFDDKLTTYYAPQYPDVYYDIALCTLLARCREW